MLSRDALLGLGFCRLRASSRSFPTPCKCCGKPILVSFAHSVLFPARVPSDHIVLLFNHLFSSYVRSFSRCARVFGIKGVSGLFASYSQVREARTLLFGIKMLAWMSFRGFRAYMWLWMYGVNWFVVWKWNCVGGREEQWQSLIDSPRRELEGLA